MYKFATDQQVGLGVSGIVISQNNILLIKRADLKTWSFPGGTVERGESLKDAVQREVLEETGIKVRVEELTGIYLRTKFRKNLLFAFKCSKVSGEEKKSPESIEVAWVSVEQAKMKLNENLRIRLNDSLKDDRDVQIRLQNRTELKLVLFWKIKDIQKMVRRLFALEN